MAIAGSPKKLAQDVAEGFLTFSPPTLRQYTAADVKILLTNLAMVARELRQEQIPLDNIMALKARNMKLSRISQAEMVIRAHCKKMRIPV
jgi:hypothetical protein